MYIRLSCCFCRSCRYRRTAFNHEGIHQGTCKEISVFDYSQVIFAALLGFVFLQQIPDYLSVIGYVIIIGSAIFKWNYNLRYEEKV